jgi:NAD(P)-dependent dehydrogenase (short-subunit alcohol dehydrogenase family)
VTKPDQIDSAFTEIQATLTKTKKTLHGLVNNAGITCLMPNEAIPENKLRQVWDVNYFGALNITRKFLPLLRAAPRGRARIVFLGSCSPYGWSKFFGQYSQTKVAIELLADELRRELKPWNIKTSVVEPGLFQTKLHQHMTSTADTFEEYLAAGSEEAKVYEKSYRKFLASTTNPPSVPGNTFDKVSKSIEYCLRAKFPPAKRGIGAILKINRE